MAAGAVAVRGFDNAYGPGGARTLGGVWTHVNRFQLARECLLVARDVIVPQRARPVGRLQSGPV